MGSSYYQTRVPASSPYERDPRTLMRFCRQVGSCFSGADDDTTAAFWDALDKIGDYQTSSPNGVARTVVNVTGRGCLYGLVGPSLATAAAVTTWTVTVDGVAYTISHASGIATGYRSVIGQIFETKDRFITTAYEGGIPVSGELVARNANDTAAAFTTAGGSVARWQLMSPHLLSRFIKFDTSLLVTVQTAIATTGTRGDNAGALWHLDT